MNQLKPLLAFILFSISHFISVAQETGVLGKAVPANDESVRNIYAQISRSDFGSVIDNLSSKRFEEGWNDWIYLKILERSISNSFQEKGDTFRTIVCSYALKRTGFDVKLRYSYDRAFVYAYTNDVVSGTDVFIEGKKIYACLNCLSGDSIQLPTQLRSSKIRSDIQGSPFRFAVDNIPQALANDTLCMERGFFDKIINHRFLVFKVCFSESFVEMMVDYPNIELAYLYNTPLTNVLHKTLLDQFQFAMNEASGVDKVRFILQFVQLGILSLDDKDQDSFGRDRWLTPEESLIYPYIDSEDKAGLLICLIKEFLNLPVIALRPTGPNSKDKVYVGISLEMFGVTGSFKYSERTYVICDPNDDGDLMETHITINPTDEVISFD